MTVCEAERRQAKAPARVGPLPDGMIYRYNAARDEWWNREGKADYVPHECRAGGGEAGVFYLDAAAHKWLGPDYVYLTPEESIEVDSDFRREHGLGPDVITLLLD